MHQKYPRNNFRSGPKNCAKKSQAFQQYRTKNFENKYQCQNIGNNIRI